MQTVSAELAAAITAAERMPVASLQIDWDRSGSFTDLPIKDLTADISTIRVRRELTTDLPVEAKLFAGAAAASATITLAVKDPSGDPVKHAAWKYSPLNTASPLYGYDRKGAPAILKLGFVGANGVELVTVLVGTVRSLTVASGGRTAELQLADRSETMRRQVALPMIIADGAVVGGVVVAPSLNTTFLADWVFRACGYYASPPPRAGCRVSATMHGSGYPEIGTIQRLNGANGSMLAYAPQPQFPTAARWVQAVATNGTSSQQITYVLAPGTTISTNNGRTLLVEGWWKFNNTGVDNPMWVLYNTGQSPPFVSLYWESATGELELLFNRSATDAVNRVATGPTISPGTGWHYYAAQATFSSTQVSVTFRYDSTTTGPINVATSSVTGAVVLDTVGVARGKKGAFADGWLDGYTEAFQVTSESSTSTWNDAFTPTAQLAASAGVDNRLVATPVASEQGWLLLQQIAEGEYATAGFSETGTPFYWPRTRWQTPPYTTSQRTLTAATSLKDLATAEAVDQVRNKITSTVASPVVADPQTVWKLASRTSVPALGSRILLASLTDPAGNIDTVFGYGSAPGTGSRYLAGTRVDGSGAAVSNLSFAVTVLSPTLVRIAVTNPNPYTVYLTGASGTGQTGKPYVWLDGQPVQFGADVTGDIRVEAEDPDSITTHGEQLLELPPSEFRQDPDSVQQLVDDLIVDLANPGPILADVPIGADPRLQLGDRVTTTDPDGLAGSAEFNNSAIETTLDAGGMGQVISSRAAVVIAEVPVPPPVVPLVKANSFEGGTDGVTISTANSGGASGDAFDAVYVTGTGAAAPVYRATLPIRNLRSARAVVAGAAGSHSMTAWSWPVDQPNAYQRCYFRIPSPLPSGTIYLLQSTGAGNTNAAQVRLTSTGTIQATNATDTLLGTSTTTLAAGTLVRLEMHHQANPAGNGLIEARIFAGADLDSPSDAPTETLGPYSTAAGTLVAEQRAGITFASVAATVDYDNYAVSTVTWPGPTPAPPALGSFDRLLGVFIDGGSLGEQLDITDPAVIPQNAFRDILFHWNLAGIPGRIGQIHAAHPTARLWVYQDPAMMIAAPHEANRPTTCVTREQAITHGTGSDDWRLHRSAKTITTSTNTTPPTFTTSAAHALYPTEPVTISGHSIGAYNGSWVVKERLSATTFNLKHPTTGADMAAAGAGSGGTVTTQGVVSDAWNYLQAGHIGRASYRTACTAHFAQIAQDFRNEGVPEGQFGVIFDDLNTYPGHGFSAAQAPTTEFPTDASYQTAMVGLLGVIGPAARAQGLLTSANIACDPWDSLHLTGYTSFVQSGHLNHAFREHTVYFPDGVLFTGATWTDVAHLQEIAEAAGVDVALNAWLPPSPDTTRIIRYLLATWYVHWDGQAGSSLGYNDGRPLSSYTEYRNLLGAPIGPRVLVSGTSTDGAWRRYFENGVACINAKSAAGTVTFTLDGSYLDPSGTPVTSVGLGSANGMILLKP